MDRKRAIDMFKQLIAEGVEPAKDYLQRFEQAIAREHAELAAEDDNGSSQFKMGFDFYNSDDFARAVQCFERASAQGHLPAMFFLAECHFHGDGVPKDWSRAIPLYKQVTEKAEDELVSNAMFRLGLIHDLDSDGSAEFKDEPKAIEYLKQAAALGNEMALILLSTKSSIDRKQALQYLIDASDMGNRRAQMMLVDRYLNGEGTEKDPQLAIDLLKQIAKEEFAPAITKLGICYMTGAGVEIDKQQAIEHFKEASSLGEPEAMFLLAACYFYGTGTTVDQGKAIELYHQAAELNHMKAQGQLGLLYLTGNSVPQDEKIGLYFLTQAAEQGDETAKANLAIHEED